GDDHRRRRERGDRVPLDRGHRAPVGGAGWHGISGRVAPQEGNRAGKGGRVAACRPGGGRGRVPAVALALLASFLLAGCHVTVGVGLQSGADGSGSVQATVTLDRDAADQVPDLASQLRVADLARAGWVVTPPARRADGSVLVRASKAFPSPAQVPAVLAELAGPAGPLRDFRLVQHRGLFVTTTHFSGTADLGPGIEAFGDPQLRQRLGGSSIGVDPAELERQLGIALAKVVDVRVSLHLAGSGSVHS